MKCIYHNDMDGRCAGALVAIFTGNCNPDNYIEADYKEFPIDKILPRETVYIVDYSFTKDTVHHLDKLLTPSSKKSPTSKVGDELRPAT